MAQQVAWRERSTGVWMYKTSPNHDEGYWPCNAAKALPVLGLRGLGAVERRVLGGFVDVQTDEVRGLDRAGMGHGSALTGEGYAKRHGFLGNFGEWTANPLLISHGLAPWALAGQYRTTRDDLPKSFEWLFHNMAYVVHREFRVGVESSDGVPSCAPGEGERWLALRACVAQPLVGYSVSTLQGHCSGGQPP